MTFDQIVAEICDRLNYTSPAATIRVGKDVNDRYRRLTSSIGLDTTRRTQVSANSTPGSKLMTFDGVEKVLAVIDKTDPKHVIVLTQFTPDEMHIAPLRGTARHWAVIHTHPTSVDILVDCEADEVFTLYADGMENLATLSGAMAPNLPESFHDILIFGAMADEYRKMEKVQLMTDAEQNFAARSSDLRMWIAKSSYVDIIQGIRNERFGRWYRDAQLAWD